MKKKHKKNEVSPLVEMQNTFRDATGLTLIAEGAKWVATGVFMGTSDAVPGYAGGTTLALLGFYHRLILMAKSLFIPEEGITRLRALVFMLPFGIGWIGGVFGFAKLTEYMMHNGLGIELLFFFSAFVTFAIPVFLIRNKPKLFNIKTKRIIISKTWWWVFLGFILIIGVALGSLLGYGGVPFSKHHLKNTHYRLDQFNWLKLAGVAFLAGFITLLPGGSGAIVQLLSGMYDKIHWMIMAHFHDNWLGLLIFASFTFLGMMLMVFLMAKMMIKFKKQITALSFGMMLASIAAILIVPESKVWVNLSEWEHIVGVIFAWLLGAVFGMIILCLGVRKIKKDKEMNKIKEKK